MPLNFYSILAILLVGFIAFTFRDFGPMKKAEERAFTTGKTITDGAIPMMSEKTTSVAPKEGIPYRAANMIVPILSMIVMMPIGLLITGHGEITAGSGSTSVLWSVLVAIVVASALSIAQRILDARKVADLTLKGMGGLIPLGILMNFAFAIGDTTKMLGTGQYVASVAQAVLHPAAVAPIVFLASCFIAFSTGTS